MNDRQNVKYSRASTTPSVSTKGARIPDVNSSRTAGVFGSSGHVRTRASGSVVQSSSRGARAGSMAGYKGGRSTWLTPNGSGYTGARRAAKTQFHLGSVSPAGFAPRGMTEKAITTGRFANSAKDTMSKLLKLNKIF